MFNIGTNEIITALSGLLGAGIGAWGSVYASKKTMNKAYEHQMELIKIEEKKQKAAEIEEIKFYTDVILTDLLNGITEAVRIYRKGPILYGVRITTDLNKAIFRLRNELNPQEIMLLQRFYSLINRLEYCILNEKILSNEWWHIANDIVNEVFSQKLNSINNLQSSEIYSAHLGAIADPQYHELIQKLLKLNKQE